MDAQLSENIDPAASPAAYCEAPTELPKICTTAPKPTTESLIGSAVQQWADRIMRRIDERLRIPIATNTVLEHSMTRLMHKRRD